MHLLKQSTAATVIVGPVLDSAGAAVTTAVVGDFRLAKEGTSAVLSGATVTHDANGYYLIALTTTNTNTTGRLAIYSNNTAQSMGATRFMVLLPSVYDAIVTNAVNTTGGLPAATGAISTLAGAISTFAGGAVASVTSGVTVTTNNDKTGYSLTAGTGLGNQTANITGNLSGSVGSVTGAVGSVTGNVGGNVSGSVGSISGVTFPTRFNDLEIAANGHVSAVVQSIANNSITASSIQGGAITAAKFATDAITAAALAADAVTEIQAGLATTANQATIIQYIDTEIAAIKTVTDRLNTGLVQDGAVWQFTVNMLENGPAGAGGGSATLGNQELILDQLDLIQNKTDLISGAGAIGPLLAGAVLEPGTITGFPSSLTIGDSYTTANGRAIQLPIVDTDGNPISSTGSLLFADASVTFTISRARETDPNRIITGTATVVDPAGTGTSGAPYALVQLSSSETAKGKLGYKYNAVLKFTWPGTGTDVMSFESSTEVQFDN